MGTKNIDLKITLFCFFLQSLICRFPIHMDPSSHSYIHRIIKIPGQVEVNVKELERIISSRIDNIKAIVLDLNGTITSLFRMPAKELVDLMNNLNENNVPIAILTTTPFLAKIKLGSKFYIGNKENIVDFMQKYNLKPEDLVIIANDFLGPDKILLEKAPKALAFNVGNFLEDLPFGLITTELKGPQATKEILKLIFYYKFEGSP